MNRKVEKSSLIQELDKISFWGCKKVKMGTALCAVLATYKDWNQECYENLEMCKNKMGKYIIRLNEITGPVPCFVLSSYNISRTDQTEMFDRLAGLFEEKCVIQAVKGKSVFRDVKTGILAIWFLQMYKLKLTVLQKKIILLYIYVYYFEAVYLFSEIEKRRNKIKVVAVFDDIFPIDNIVVQLCRNTGLKTATFHHAIINGSYNYIEYRHSVSDYFLAWGNYTRDIAIHYGMDKNKIKVLGPLNKIGEEKKDLKTKNQKVFGILARGTVGTDYMNENIDMIHIANAFAQKYGYKYILRLHPADSHAGSYMKYVNKSFFIKGNKKDTLLEFLDQTDFCICANTSAYAEAIYYGKMCYRYIPKHEEKKDVCKGIQFGKISDFEQLEEKYKQYNASRDLDKRKERIAEYIFEKNAENNYKTFFNGLAVD